MANNNKKEYICQLYAKCQTPMGLGCIKQTINILLLLSISNIIRQVWTYQRGNLYINA